MTFVSSAAEATDVRCHTCHSEWIVFENGSYRCAGLADMTCTWVMPSLNHRTLTDSYIALACYKGLMRTRGTEPNPNYIAVLEREAGLHG